MNERKKDIYLIAGGTSGIGLATACAVASRQADALMLVGRSQERAARAVETVRAAAPGSRVEASCADVTTPAGAKAASEACLSAFGRIDALVSTAGGSDMPRLLHETPLDEVPAIISRITSGVLLPVRAALPHMMEQGRGAIVCVASDAGKVATPGEAVIGAAMAAIIMFCRGLAIEGKRNGIRVNAVTPSIVRGTPLYDALMAEPFAGRLFAKAEERAQLGVVTAVEVADLVAFLCSDDAAKITGQAISVNGGISAA